MGRRYQGGRDAGLAPGARSDALRALLVAAVQQQPIPPGSPATDPDLLTADMVVDAAERHRVAPAVFLALRAAEGPPSWLAPLAERYERQVVRHLASSGDLAVAAAVLDRLGAPWAAMKGPVLSDHLWPRPDMREYYDLDVVVDRRAFRAAIDALEASGSSSFSRNWPLIHQLRQVELPLVLPHGVTLDLHWHVINSPRRRADARLDMDGMLARAVRVPIGGVPVPVFDPVDQLITLAQHAAFSGGGRLVWLKDLERAASAPGVHPDEVAVRTSGTGVGPAVALMLRRAGRALGVDLSAPGVRHTAWSRAAAAADRWIEVPGVSPGARTGEILYQAAYHSTLASLRAARRVRRGDLAALVSEDPSAPGNPLDRDVPSPDDEAAYFAELEGAEEP